MGYKEKDMSKVRDPVAYVAKESKAMISKRFIHIVCSDPQLDFDLSRLLVLFATDMPETYGGYGHHRHPDHH